VGEDAKENGVFMDGEAYNNNGSPYGLPCDVDIFA